MRPTQPSLDLFSDVSEHAAAELASGLDAWLRKMRAGGYLRRTSSEQVYRAMWGSFTEWCLSEHPGVRLLTLSADDLTRFMATRHGMGDQEANLTDRYAWRMLSLIDRVLKSTASDLEVEPNNAAANLIASLPDVRNANTSDPGLPAYLPAHQARRLVDFLLHLRTRENPELSWHKLRNGAAVALQLGAGLAPGEVRALRLSSVISGAPGRFSGLPWKLVVPADGNTPERETPIARWAGQLLKNWIAVRAEIKIPGEWLFISTKSGKQWTKAGQYMSAQQILEEAGVGPLAGGTFALRHTFALRQLRRGKTPDEVARWLGIVDVENMKRYARVLVEPVDIE